MLVLSRKINEKILIGNNITITVVEIAHGKIRLGIEAPRDVHVYREEIAPKRNPNEQQSKSGPSSSESSGEDSAVGVPPGGL